MLQQSTPHVIQTADGQTLIYQPVQVINIYILQNMKMVQRGNASHG